MKTEDLLAFKVPFESFINVKLGKDVCLNQLAENEALIMAEDVVDKILEAGAKHEYEKYIEPKIRPWLVDDINNE